MAAVDLSLLPLSPALLPCPAVFSSKDGQRPISSSTLRDNWRDAYDRTDVRFDYHFMHAARVISEYAAVAVRMCATSVREISAHTAYSRCTESGPSSLEKEETLLPRKRFFEACETVKKQDSWLRARITPRASNGRSLCLEAVAVEPWPAHISLRKNKRLWPTSCFIQRPETEHNFLCALSASCELCCSVIARHSTTAWACVWAGVNVCVWMCKSVRTHSSPA